MLNCKGTCITLVLLATYCCTANAQVYKWRDDNGKVHYSDSPPSSAAKTDKLNIRNEPTSTPIPPQPLQGRQANILAQADARLRNEEWTRQQEALKRKSQEMACTSARERLKRAENMFVRRNENGLLVGNAEKQEAISAANDQVQASCN